MSHESDSMGSILGNTAYLIAQERKSALVHSHVVNIRAYFFSMLTSCLYCTVDVVRLEELLNGVDEKATF
jgi:hypothetical protein